MRQNYSQMQRMQQRNYNTMKNKKNTPERLEIEQVLPFLP
jgi:ribosomal protein L33